MKDRKIATGFFISTLFAVALVFGYQMRASKFDLESVAGMKNVVPIVVIGSGAAGCQAAVYGAREHFRTVVLTGDKPGGQLMETTRVDNWPGKRNVTGPEIMGEARAQAQEAGAEFLHASIEKVDFSVWPFKLWTDEEKEINALSVIVVTGATPRRLYVPGEDSYWGDGVTSCAVCDAPFFEGRSVVVVGGGDSAVEEASVLAHVAKKVTVLVRKGRMRAATSGQMRLDKLSNVEVLFNREIKEILGDDDGVTGVNLLNNETNETYRMPTDGVFLATGHDPNTQLFKSFLQLDQGYIVLEPGMHQTSVPGVFAAGDVADKRYKQAGKAAGDGSAAALDAISFLREIGFNNEVSRKLDKGKEDLFEDQEAPVTEIATLGEFEKEVLKSDLPVAIDFGATWCATCPAFKQAFESVSRKFVGKVKFVAVDIDKGAAIIKDERVRVAKIPCLLVFKNGQLAARHYPMPGIKRSPTEVKDPTEYNLMDKRQLNDYIRLFVD